MSAARRVPTCSSLTVKRGQDSVSTNSTTRAFILFLFLIAEYHYFCFQLLEQLVVAVVELVQQFEIDRQTNLFVRCHGES